MYGLYQFARMPLGLNIASATRCRFVQRLVDVLGVQGILAYLNDVRVHLEYLDSHIHLLGLVFNAHRQAGIRLNTIKTHLFQEEVEYLTHLVSAEGIKLIPSYDQKILDWSLPQPGKQLSSFSDFANFYGDFLPGFINITACLNEVKTKRVIEWTQEMKNNFITLKQMFAAAPSRATPDFASDANRFFLTIDFSKTAIGAVLSQEQNGVERFLDVKGRKCRSYENNYHGSKGELLALLCGITKFDHILRLSQFNVVTDSATVLHWSTIKDSGGTVRRWFDYIQQFNFTVTHRAGKTNINKDLISRATQLDNPPPSDKDSITQGSQKMCPLPWKQLSSEYCSEYLPPSCTGKICTIVQLPWQLSGAIADQR